MTRSPDRPEARRHGPLDAILEICWLLVAILVPLVVNLWAQQPFEPSKAAILRSLVWVMAGLWLIDCLLLQRSLRHELADNPLQWPALAWAAVQVLATILAADRNLAIWGSYERSQGTLTLLSYLLLFLIVSSRMRTGQQAQHLLLALALSSLPLIGLGLAQALGWSSAGLISDARSPVFATLGRSNFLGAYLAMLVPLTIVLAWNADRWWQRLAGLGLAEGQMAVIAITLARGTWLAAGVGLAVLGLFWFWPRLHRGWRIAASAGILAGLAGVLAAIFWLGGEGGSTAARLAIWQATVDLIAKRPLLGYGPDTLGLVFPQVYPPQLVYYQGRGIVVDRAHNLFLDWTVTAGLLGLLAGLWLLATFAITGWRAIQQATAQKQRSLLVACLAAVVAGVAGNLVSFDVTATAMTTWLLMAVMVSLYRNTRQESIISHTELSPRGSLRLAPAGDRQARKSYWRWADAGLILIIVAMAMWAIIKANLQPIAADALARTADQRAEQGDRLGAIAAGEQAVTLWPAEPAHHLALSWTYLQQAGVDGNDPKFWLQQAEAQLLAARDLRPGDHHTWAALGELYGIWGNRWDAAKLPQAHQAYQQATDLAPQQAMLYTAWGMVDLESGDLAQAGAKLRRAVDLDATDGYAWTHLGNVELAQGHTTPALAAFQQAIRWEPELAHAHVGLARSYWLLGQRRTAEASLAHALRLDPNNAAAQALQREMNQGP